MLYLLFGTDRQKIIARADALTGEFLCEDPTRTRLEITPESFSEAVLDEAITANSLFGLPPVVVCSDLLEEEDRRELVLNRLGGLTTSPTIFIFREGKLDAKTLVPFKKVAKVCEEFTAPFQSPVSSFQLLYGVGDALATRDKKKTWVAYQRALLAGHAEEEIFWTVVRQVKNMTIVKSGGTMADFGTKSDFVYKKAIGAAKSFTMQELAKLHGDLVTLFHDAHRGLLDFDLAMERWLLTI